MEMRFWIRVIIIIVTCVIPATKPTSVEDSTLRCKLPLACIPLKNCDSLLAQIKTSQDPQSELKFLKSQVCGFQNNEPKICCPEVVPNHKSIKKQLNESPCNPSFQCVSLLDCGPLMHLLHSEKPVIKGIVKFIKAQQCGVDKLYPKVCCKLLVEEKKDGPSVDVTTSRQNLVPQIPLTTSSENLTPEVITATTEKVVTSTMSLKKKAEIMNRFFNSDFLDFVIFDFL